MIAYPVPGKKKSADICAAFIEGAGEAGRQCDAAVFYGVTAGNIDRWHAARQSAAGFYYIDNSYFDVSRATHLRVTRNRLQHRVNIVDNPAMGRLANLGLPFKPWRDRGDGHVVVCPQSPEFMRDLAEYKGDWTQDAVAELANHTIREIRLRAWNRDKIALSKTLAEDLQGAWALVTWSSAAAITALIEGVPVFVGSVDCAAWDLAGWGLRHIESPRTPDWREQWAADLANNQWTMDEMKSGLAWRMLNA